MNVRKSLLVAAAALALVVSPAASSAQNSDLQAQVQKKLTGSHYKNVTVQVDNNGNVLLGGTVDLYAYKAEADEKAHHVKGVKGVDNEIQVAGKQVSDQELQQKIGRKIEYDRAGWRDQPFNAIGVQVQNGIVTLSGHASVPWAKQDALAIAENTPGVRDVIDDVTVDPESPFDDRIRIAEYRAIYGHPALNKYAIDPARAIRISVNNGVVTLYGTVDSQMDKNIANIQANQVSGVFKVINNLVVANQKKEKK